VEWFKIMLQSGYAKTVEIMRSRRYYEEEIWDCQPEKRNEFILRMAIIGSEDGTKAAFIAKQVMIALYQAGYGVDLIAFGRLIGMIILKRDGELVTDAEIEEARDAVLLDV